MFFHRVRCFGLVDKDDLTSNEITSLNEDGIHILPVAIIENIFLIPEIAQHIFRIVGEEDKYSKDSFSKVVIDWIEFDENWKSKSIKQRLVKFYEREIGKAPSKLSNLVEELESRVATIYPSSIITSFAKEYEQKLGNSKNNNDPKYLLEVCRGKHILSKFANLLQLKDQKALESKILRNISKDSGLIDELKAQLPKFG